MSENVDFDTKAGKLFEEYRGEKVGITQVKYLVTILKFCKKIDPSFQMPMPKKDICKNWNSHDWCDYIDATWQRRELPI